MRRQAVGVLVAMALAGCAASAVRVANLAPPPDLVAVPEPPPLASDGPLDRSGIPVAATPRARVTNPRSMVDRCEVLFEPYRRLMKGGDAIAVLLAVYVGDDHQIKASRVIRSGGIPALDLVARKCISDVARVEPAAIAPGDSGSWQYMRWTWRWSD